jgi:hypothetical protein
MRAPVMTLALLALIPLLFSAPDAALALDAQCKGLEQSVCASRQGCSWVKAYKTSKGREVAAFCRKKPERKKATAAPGTPKS